MPPPLCRGEMPAYRSDCPDPASQVLLADDSELLLSPKTLQPDVPKNLIHPAHEILIFLYFKARIQSSPSRCWTDQKGPFIAALATVVIAVLTGIYVHYSHAQWRVMRDQLPELHTPPKLPRMLLQPPLPKPRLRRSSLK
jgi:hypothetical protein